MCLYGIGWTTLGAIPDLDAWDTLKGAGCDLVRFTVDMASVFNDPSAINWLAVDTNIQRITQAGLKVYFNAHWLPSWASQNKPTYVSLIRPIEGYKQDPNRPNEGIEGTCEWVLDSNGKVIGPSAIRFASQRDYLRDPGHISSIFVQHMAFRCVKNYSQYVDWWGIWNEPGGPEFYPPIFGDSVNGGQLGNTIRDWYIPELNDPWWNGLNVSVGRIGPEADGADVLRRVLELAPQIQIISYHPYGPNGISTEGSIDKCRSEWWPLLDRISNGREEWISEIGDSDQQRLLEWTKEVIAQRRTGAIVYLTPDHIFEAGTWPDSPVVSSMGQQFKQLFKGPSTKKQRAVG